MTRTMIEIALFAAIGFVLDELQGAVAVSFPNGGSIGFAMVAVLLIAYRRGALPAILTGLVIGLFDFATKAYVLHPLQVMFDYLLPYGLVGVAGFFRPLFNEAKNKKEKITWLIIGTVLGGLLKFVSHFIAGVVWWGDPEYFAWGLNGWNIYLYALVYNIAFIGPSIILCSGLLVTLYLKAPILFKGKEFASGIKEEKREKSPFVVSTLILFVGIFLFSYFLINYINSYTWKDSSSKFSFNQDSMVIFITGIAFMLCAINNYFKILKKRFKYANLIIFIAVVAVLHVIYTASHIIVTYIEGSDVSYYRIWFSLVLMSNPLYIYLLFKLKERSLKLAK